MFGSVALFLAVVGVYGVKAYLVSRRTREIGIRMALGALPQSIYRLVMVEAVWLVGIGAALGAIGAVMAGIFMRHLAERLQEPERPIGASSGDVEAET